MLTINTHYTQWDENNAIVTTLLVLVETGCKKCLAKIGLNPSSYIKKMWNNSDLQMPGGRQIFGVKCTGTFFSCKCLGRDVNESIWLWHNFHIIFNKKSIYARAWKIQNLHAQLRHQILNLTWCVICCALYATSIILYLDVFLKSKFK